MNDELRTERRISAEAIPEDLREINFSAGFFFVYCIAIFTL